MNSNKLTNNQQDPTHDYKFIIALYAIIIYKFYLSSRRHIVQFIIILSLLLISYYNIVPNPIKLVLFMAISVIFIIISFKHLQSNNVSGIKAYISSFDTYVIILFSSLLMIIISSIGIKCFRNAELSRTASDFLIIWLAIFFIMYEIISIAELSGIKSSWIIILIFVCTLSGYLFVFTSDFFLAVTLITTLTETILTVIKEEDGGGEEKNTINKSIIFLNEIYVSSLIIEFISNIKCLSAIISNSNKHILSVLEIYLPNRTSSYDLGDTLIVGFEIVLVIAIISIILYGLTFVLSRVTKGKLIPWFNNQRGDLHGKHN